MNAVVFVVSVSDVCDQVDHVIPARQVDAIDGAHEQDPVHQVDRNDEHTEDDGRTNGTTNCRFCNKSGPEKNQALSWPWPSHRHGRLLADLGPTLGRPSCRP